MKHKPNEYFSYNTGAQTNRSENGQMSALMHGFVIILYHFYFPAVAFCNLNHFDFYYADADISSFANDGTINHFNNNCTANYYVTAVNDYFRFN